MADAKVKEIVKNAANSGAFGAEFTFVDLVPSNKEGEDQFASDVIFARVKLESGSANKDVSVVIKRQQKLDVVRDMMCCDQQFYNEHLMYSEILPFIDTDNVTKEDLPQWFYSFASLGENFDEDIIVVEDLKQHDFELAKEKVFLDFDHCVIALEALGRFHALSYIMKQANREEFLKKVGKLKHIQMKGPDEEESKKFLIASIERGVLPLMEAGEHVSVLEKFLESVQDPAKLREEFNRAEEPMAVLCHGDFNRNNMLFRYSDDGKPEKVKLFDLATSRYASPAIDLSFFLFMNTTGELRRTHWEDLLQTYHRSLSAAAPGCAVPTLEDVHAELRRRGVYGFLICSFFLPMMMDNPSKAEVEEFMNLSPEEMLKLSRTKGGERVTKAVMDVVRDLVRIGAVAAD